jgi:AcrR family transcriptional regulator
MGRPREFDMDQAIHVATMLFWNKGYEQTSLADLTREIGITPPSFYFAFVSKNELFQKIVEHYAATYLGFMDDALSKPTAREVAEAILYGCAEAYTRPEHPPGCLIVNNFMPCANNDNPIRQGLARGRKARFSKLRKRLQNARTSGDLPTDSDPEELARYLISLRWGMAVEAQSGATKQDLYKVAARAMQAWPTVQSKG